MPSAGKSPLNRRVARLRHSSAGAGLLLVAPALVLVIVFLLLPIVFTVVLSVAQGAGFRVTGFAGFSNYQQLLSDSQFLSLDSFPPAAPWSTASLGWCWQCQRSS